MTFNRINRILAKLPAMTVTAVTFAVILWLTLSPHPLPDNDINWFTGVDKVCHAIMFGFFAWIGASETLVHFPGMRSNRRAVVWVWAGVSAFIGVAVEFLQASMGLGRTAEYGDMLADAAGALLAALIL